MDDVRKLLDEYVPRFGPHTTKLGLAKKLHEEHPKIFKSIEYARGRIRSYCGMNGAKNRKNNQCINNNKHFILLDPEVLTPQMTYEITAEKANILALMDVHVPFHDIKAVETAVEYGLKNNANIILFNGDIFDHTTNGKYEKDPKKRDFEEDYYQYTAFLFEMRCAFPTAEFIFKIGNHELWWGKHFIRNGMGGILNVSHFEYSKVMGFEELGIRMVQDYTTIKVGKFNVLHGHEYKGGAGSDRPAKWLSLRTYDSAICGHWHKTDDFFINSHGGNQLSYHSVGCLSQLNPQYMPYNRWNHGFLFMEKDGNDVEIKNKRLSKNYKIL